MDGVADGKRDALSTRSVAVRARRTTPLTFGALEAELCQSFPLEVGESWDRSGLLVGERDEVITRVAIALDPTPSAVQTAAEQGANLLLTHHPAFLTPPARLCASIGEAGLGGATVFEAIAAGVGLMNFHTCLDATPAAARVLPTLLNVEFTETFIQPLIDHPGFGYGSICRKEPGDSLNTLEQLAARCTSVFGRAPRVWGAPRREVSSIVMAGGSVGFLLEPCVERGVDVLVCGEVHYHDALAASSAGLGIIEVGHDVSEFPLAVVMTQALLSAGLSQDTIVAIDQSGHWHCPDAVRL